MNSNNVCRETIAKLMANENLVVTHSPAARTASFDVKNRELVLPIWNDGNPYVYTLLISHEVGHALYTPQNELLDILKTNPELKNIINVIEDARIEKLIQKKYPGIRYSFVKGYRELFDKNFFGTEGRQADSYELLDRLNIHFKVGSFGYYSIAFSEDENVWVNKIASCVTFSDVVSTAIEFFEFMKNESEKQNNSENKPENKTNNKNSEANSYADKDIQNDPNEVDSDTTTKSNKVSNERNDVEEEKKQQSKNEPESSNDSQIQSETQESFDNSVSKNLIEDCKVLTRLKVSKLNMEDYIVSYKSIHKNIDAYYSATNYITYYSSDNIKVKYSQFKQKHGFSVNSMANLFEMKKRAKLYSRSATSKTGQLNMNAIHSYRYNEDVFRKITTTPEGKSHGMVMFFDMSASMEQTISSCIEQILILSMFCKKINIPFDVYGFSDNSMGDSDYYSRRGYYSYEESELKIDKNFKFRHYLSSKMSNLEYDFAFMNMLRLSSGHQYRCLPRDEYLNSTPLIPCVLMSKNVISNFKNQYGLDIVNAIYLTDGGDTHGILEENFGQLNKIERDYKRKITLKSEITNREYVIKKSDDNDYRRGTDDVVKNLFNIVKDETGANIISFYLLHTGIEKRYSILDGKCSIETFSKFYKQNGFYEFKNHFGYDSYYIIRSNSLNLDENSSFDELDADADEYDEKEMKKNIKKIAKSFDKYMSTCSKNKIFLNRFIEQIS